MLLKEYWRFSYQASSIFYQYRRCYYKKKNFGQFIFQRLRFKNFSEEDNQQLDVFRSFSHFKLGKPKKNFFFHKFDYAVTAPQG